MPEINHLDDTQCQLNQLILRFLLESQANNQKKIPEFQVEYLIVYVINTGWQRDAKNFKSSLAALKRWNKD